MQLWHGIGTVTHAVYMRDTSSLVQPTCLLQSLHPYLCAHDFCKCEDSQGLIKFAVLSEDHWKSSPLQPYVFSRRRQTSGLWVWSPLRFLLLAAAAQASSWSSWSTPCHHPSLKSMCQKVQSHWLWPLWAAPMLARAAYSTLLSGEKGPLCLV